MIYIDCGQGDSENYSEEFATKAQTVLYNGRLCNKPVSSVEELFPEAVKRIRKEERDKMLTKEINEIRVNSIVKKAIEDAYEEGQQNNSNTVKAEIAELKKKT